MNGSAFPIRVRLSATGLAMVCAFAGALPVRAQQLSFTPFHKNGIYELGERAGWTVTLAEGAIGPVNQYSYVIRKNNLDVMQKGALDLSSGSATIETKQIGRAHV